MSNILSIIQIILSVILIAGILIQRSEAGLGSAFGADGLSAGHYTRRGLEKLVFNGTIVVAILFAISAFASILLSR
ncbi:MAG: preprotein translocase subunit SecG [Patescibacteria group bacterium]